MDDSQNGLLSYLLCNFASPSGWKKLYFFLKLNLCCCCCDDDRTRLCSSARGTWCWGSGAGDRGT